MGPQTQLASPSSRWNGEAGRLVQHGRTLPNCGPLPASNAAGASELGPPAGSLATRSEADFIDRHELDAGPSMLDLLAQSNSLESEESSRLEDMRPTAVRDECHAPPRRLVETRERDAKDRAGRGPERLRPGRIRATA